MEWDVTGIYYGGITLPFEIIRNDITRMRVDAIVNAANSRLSTGGGVTGAIHKAAGPELLAECMKLGGCQIGDAKVTRAYKLPCKYVIHTVGPIWQGGQCGERVALVSCYRKSLELALEYNCKSIAFPLLASGAHGYPKDQALKVATDTISDFLLHNVPDNDLMVYLVTFTKESLSVSSKLVADIKQYIDDHYVETHFNYHREYSRRASIKSMVARECAIDEICAPCAPMASDEWNPDSIEDALNMIDESFSEMILRKIQEKGMKNADCYKKANIDKKLFSKIITNKSYKPKKSTALALAVALELPLEETRELLMKAGMALSHSDKFDIIVEFFIKHGRYDIFEINEVLYSFDQGLLGGALL